MNENRKSARKKFWVMRTRQSIMSLFEASDDEVNERLDKIQDALETTFGEAEATSIIEDAISSTDDVFTNSIQSIIVDSARRQQETDGE